MSNRVLEIRRRLDGVVAPGENLIFDEGRVASPEILYNGITGIITFNITGQFVINWWVATETTPTGPIEFALVSSQADYIWSCSPQKTGQVTGFGLIEVLQEGTTMELRNTTNSNNVLSREATFKAYLLVTTAEAIGPTGPTGADGRSAYQVAVDKGYEGTEEEWLSGLIGPTGPQGDIGSQGETGPAGPQGSNGATGEDGRSAYQVAVDNGFVGTEEEWLASIVGPAGPQGETGPEGPKGDPGEADAGTFLSFANSESFAISANEDGSPWDRAFVGLIHRYVRIAPSEELELPPKLNVSVPMARDGKITDISFEYVYDDGVTLTPPPTGAVIIGEIWICRTGVTDNVFRYLPGTRFEATEKFNRDMIQTGILHLSEPAQVYAGDRLSFVVSYKQPPPVYQDMFGYVVGVVNIV